MIRIHRIVTKREYDRELRAKQVATKIIGTQSTTDVVLTPTNVVGTAKAVGTTASASRAPRSANRVGAPSNRRERARTS